jgi:hypothetical protein
MLVLQFANKENNITICVIYYIFKASVSISGYITLDVRMSNKYELERIRKEAVVAYFSVMFPHSPGRTGDDHENNQDSLCTGRDSNLPSPN